MYKNYFTISQFKCFNLKIKKKSDPDPHQIIHFPPIGYWCILQEHHSVAKHSICSYLLPCSRDYRREPTYMVIDIKNTKKLYTVDGKSTVL